MAAIGTWHQHSRRARVLDSDLTGQGQRGKSGSRRVGLGVAAILGLLSLLAAACSSSPGPNGGGQHQQAAGSPPAPPPAQVTITPADGSTHARPNKGISVNVSSGKISSVTVTAGKTHAARTATPGGAARPTKRPPPAGARPKGAAHAVRAAGG